MKSGVITGWVGPLFVALCLVAGGSVQWPWATALLRVIAIGMLVATLSAERERGMWPPLQLAGLAVLLAVIQLVPLPSAIWIRLPGHTFVATNYQLLGVSLPALPLSLDPEATLSSILSILVPTAVFAALSVRNSLSPVRLIASVVVVVAAGALLGILQWQGHSQRFYLYPVSDWSSASGFFANPNHMGTLLIAAIPLAVGALAERWRAHRRRSRRLPPLVAFTAVIAVAVAVIPLEMSWAAILMLPPVAMASALIPGWGRLEKWRKPAAATLVVLMLAALVGGYVLRDRITATGDSSVVTRAEIWGRAGRAAVDFAPFGSGLGSFERLYPRYEDPDQVNPTYVNHAHNDYLELALEGGLPAILLLALFLWWWSVQSIRAWRGGGEFPIPRAASIAGSVILVHSLVDYPLRTPAIAALFAACVAMVVAPQRVTGATHEGDVRSTRHRIIR